ncbi:MAG: hypothetical protein EA406_12830 [Rhodospirillales bacterium]|nr:MAG: hypothetical protein EA406_12830 [Rhodospirillales bacterium]
MRLDKPGHPDNDIRDIDRDSLHILPLSMLPFQTKALKRARMIKNVRLEAVIEFFGGSEMGSGQLSVEDAAKEFGWPRIPVHPDLIILRKIAELSSYDVYSLRLTLRERDLVVNEINALRLSPKKVKELTSYMSAFTRPLLLEVYGTEDMSIQSLDDIINLFRSPDLKRAREKLRSMASRLGIGLSDIPKFLEDYGDIFLSLSYYRNCLDSMLPNIDKFVASLQELRRSHQLKHDVNLRKTCEVMERTTNDLTAAITGRFENFDRSTDDMWHDLSAERFRKVENLIRSYHTTIGGVLCALSVKIDAWTRVFPDPKVGAPMKRAEFIHAEMKQGFEHIRKIEDNAPMLASL